MTRRLRTFGQEASIPCVVADGVPVDTLCALLDQVLEGVPYRRRDRWWRAEVGDAVVINEPEGRVWVGREHEGSELHVYFNSPDDFLGDARPERIIRSWRRSLDEAVLEDKEGGRKLMDGITTAAELLVALGEAVGLADIDAWCGSSCDVPSQRFVLTTRRHRVPLPPALQVFLEQVAPPFRRLITNDPRYVDDEMIMRFRTPADLGPILTLRLVAQLPPALVGELRAVCRQEGLIGGCEAGGGR